MEAMALVVTAFVGTFFWVASPEGAVALASQRGWSPFLVGALAAVGQGTALALLFTFGDQLRRRWPWFDRQCERVRRKHGARLARGEVPLACSSGLLGLPPASVTAALAPGLGLRARMLPLLLAMRFVRLTATALVAIRIGHAIAAG
jgi:hypothetical protein